MADARTMLNKKDHLPVGIITGAHGIKGEIKLMPYSELGETALKIFFTAGHEQAFTVLKSRPHKKGFLIVVNGISTREEAEALKGQEVFVLRKSLPKLKKNEYYFADLIGLDCATFEGKGLGRVTEVFSTGGNDVIEVKGALGNILIPVIEESRIEVDLKAGRIRVHLLEGLLPEAIAGPEGISVKEK